MITLSRFRLFESLVSKLLDSGAAELVMMIVASRIAKGHQRSLDAADLFAPEDASAVDLTRLSLAGDRSPEETFTWIREADRRVLELLGFSLFDAASLRYQDKQQDKTRIQISKALQDLIAANAFYFFADPRPPQASQADPLTRRWLDIVSATVRHEQSGAFLYRRSGGAPSSEYGPLLSDFRLRLADRRIFVASERGFRAPSLSTTGILLSAILHLDPDDLLIFPHTDGIGAVWDSGDDQDDEGRGASLGRVPTSNGAMLALVAEAPFTSIMAIDRSTRIEPEAVRAFCGIFGPYQRDLSSAAETLIAASDDRALGPKEAHRMVATLADPLNARRILKAASVLARDATAASAQAQDDQEEAGVDEEWFADIFEKMRPSATNTGSFKLNYNRYVAELAETFVPHLQSNTSSYAFHAGPFDPDLFISEPPAHFLFERAAFLRDAGARIILAGPPGTGKTALVGELARLMALSVRQYSGAQLFARAWGQTERNIEAAIRDSRGSLLFLDEADSLLASREAGNDAHLHLTVTATNAFLSAIQEPVIVSPIVVATNRLATIDVGIRRRFDIVLETAPIPEDLELLAWRRLLAMEPPQNWTPIGGTVPGDYTKAKRCCACIGEDGAVSLAAALIRARRERAGETGKMPIGFVS